MKSIVKKNPGSARARNLFFFLWIIFTTNAALAQNPVDLTEGSADVLKGQDVANVSFISDNITIDEIPEKTYIEDHRSSRNSKKPGSGDDWAQNWENNFKIYHKSFSNGLSEQLKMSVKEGAPYTFIVKTEGIKLGFESGISVASRGSQWKGEVSIVETKNPDHVVARFKIEKARGLHAYNLADRIAWAYYQAGYWVGRTIRKANAK